MMDVDLFAGAGGAACGLASLGLDPVGFEWNRDAARTHTAAGYRTVVADLSSYPWTHVAGRVRLLHASPPCQPFSAAGDGGGSGDRRDGMPWVLRAVEECRPELVTVENVPGLLHRKHRAYVGAFVTRLAVLGYRVEYRVLNAADYGVPQTRERVILVARLDGHVRWPRRTHAEGGRSGLRSWVSMAAALGWDDDVEVAQKRGAGMLARHGRRPARLAVAPAPTVTDGTARRWAVSTGRRDGTQVRPAMRAAPPSPAETGGRWWRTRPATTVAGDVRVHPPGHKLNADDVARGRDGHDRAGSEALRVQLDELAALQGFPPDYPFHGNRTSVARQIGNALPPALIAAVVGVNL